MSQTKVPNDEIRRRILHDTDLIPPLPEVVVRVIALLNEGDTEPAELEEVLKLDPVLVARMLGMVNSPFFGLRREIRSITDAIMVLGYQNLRSLVMVTSTSKFLRHDFSFYGYNERGLWEHSVAVAAIAKQLATVFGMDPLIREELFIGALLHDIGKLVVLPHLSQHSLETVQAYPTFCDAETALLGIDHAEAGTLVAAKWNLSPLVAVLIQKHHRGAGLGVKEFGRYVEIIRSADHLALELGTGYQNPESHAEDSCPPELELLGCSEAEWDEQVKRAPELVEIALQHLAGVSS